MAKKGAGSARKSSRPKGRSRMINPEGGVRRSSEVHKSPRDYRRKPKHPKQEVPDREGRG